jgi:hypothetical protein
VRLRQPSDDDDNGDEDAGHVSKRRSSPLVPVGASAALKQLAGHVEHTSDFDADDEARDSWAADARDSCDNIRNTSTRSRDVKAALASTERFSSLGPDDDDDDDDVSLPEVAELNADAVPDVFKQPVSTAV